MIGKTNSQTGGAIKGEKLNISLKTNQQSHSDLVGAVITVAHLGNSTEYVWEGYEITVDVPPYLDYTVSFSEVSGYATPETFALTSVEGNVRTITGVYNTEVVNVDVTADNGEFMNGQVVTINGVEYIYAGNAITVKIPYGTAYSVSVSDKEDYIVPAKQDFTASQAERNIELQFIYNPPKDLSFYDIYDNPISQNTANCYVVSEARKYKFPLVYGNAIKDGVVNSAAFTKNSGSNSHDFVDYNGTIISSPYIETVSGVASSVQLSIADTYGVFTDIILTDGSNCRYVQFTVADVPDTGANGVISIKNSSGKILWSWLIWVWKHDLTPVTIINKTNVEYNILPVNLATKLDEGTVYGTGTTGYKNWFYQFGRPTPLICPSAYNSLELHENCGVLQITSSSQASRLYMGIQHPNYVYDDETYNSFNWFRSNHDKTFNLWDAACTSTGASDNEVVKTVYDPCPVGFKMPNGNTFTSFTTSNVIGGFENGYTFKRYSGDTVGVFFPASGMITGGRTAPNSTGSKGACWLSSCYSTNHANIFDFYDSLVRTGVDYRSTGNSVRPVQDSQLGLPVHKLTINVKGDTNTPSGYEVKVYKVIEGTDETTGEVTETLGDVLFTQTTASATYEIVWGTKYRIVASDVEGYITPDSRTYVADAVSREVSMQYVYNPAKDLSMFDIYGNRIPQTTANCYVVSEPGVYKFPLVFGNALKNGVANTASYTNNGGANSHDFVDCNGTIITTPYIEELSGTVESVQLSISDTDGIFTDMSIVDGDNCRYVQFKVASVPSTGANGVISVKNSSGIIMWNWHVWVWEHDLTPVSITNATDVTYNILPVNLATKLDEGTVYGTGTTGYKNWFYQFGRPTPLLCPSAYNSTDDHASYGALSLTIASIAANLYNGIQNPTTFYKHGNNYNWFSANSGKTFNLWDADCTATGNSDNDVTKTVYDPCPVGFKMPNGNTFTYFSTSNVVGSFANGWKFKRYSGDTVGVFFPASGYLRYADGSLNYVGLNGYVWLSSAYSQDNAYYLYFYSSYVNPQYNRSRAGGFSVRPVQEEFYAQNKTTTIRIDQTITDPAGMVTRIVNQGGIEAIRANSHRYTGSLNSDGIMELKQLDDTDGTKYLDGSNAVLTTLGTDVWMKLPQFHWKCEQYATDVWDFTVAYGTKPDDTYKTWDGNDLIGVYEAFAANGELYSVLPGTSSSYRSYSEFKSFSRARGDGYSLVKWKHHCMMAMLFFMYYGTTNSQAVCGAGTNSAEKVPGGTNSLGMTDTTTVNGNSMSINFWGLENWWGNKYEFFDDIISSSRVWTVTENDGGTRTVGTQVETNNYISKLLIGENIDLLPVGVHSASTGYCDFTWYDSGNVPIARSGFSSSDIGGVACVRGAIAAYEMNVYYGSRLAYRGEYRVVE